MLLFPIWLFYFRSIWIAIITRIAILPKSNHIGACLELKYLNCHYNKDCDLRVWLIVLMNHPRSIWIAIITRIAIWCFISKPPCFHYRSIWIAIITRIAIVLGEIESIVFKHRSIWIAIITRIAIACDLRGGEKFFSWSIWIAIITRIAIDIKSTPKISLLLKYLNCHYNKDCDPNHGLYSQSMQSHWSIWIAIITRIAI